jgi:hypothetical protein
LADHIESFLGGQDPQLREIDRLLPRPVSTTIAPSRSAWSKAPWTACSIGIEKALTLPSSIVIVELVGRQFGHCHLQSFE